MSRQLKLTPPTGVIALSISAAVVPKAKFLAMTTYGPASPLIVKPALDFGPLTTLNWLFKAGDEAERSRAVPSRSLRWLVRNLEVRGAAAVAVGLFRECRSWVHSASTLPAAALAVGLDFGIGLAEVVTLR